MTLRIIGGTLLIVNDQLANSADCCCDPPEPECRFCSNRLDTINLGTLTFVLTKLPLEPGQIYAPCDGMEGTYVFRPTCASCYQPDGGNSALRHICYWTFDCPYGGYYAFSWVPFLPPLTNDKNLEPPGSTVDPLQTAMATMFGAFSDGTAVSPRGVYIECGQLTGTFQFGGYNVDVEWDRFA